MADHLLIRFIKFFLIINLIYEIKVRSDQVLDSAKLKTHLIIDEKYDRLSKPVKDHTTKINFFMLIHLFQIVDLVSYVKLIGDYQMIKII